MTISNEQVVNAGILYVNGLISSWGSSTTLSISASGQCRDSSNIYDIYGPSTATTINGAVNGINGLDTGSLAASTFYNIYIISDPTNNPGRPVGFLLSTSATPLLPFGYGAYRKIGYWPTDGSVHFLLGYVSGSGSSKRFTYDSPVATSVTAGTSATYAAIDLSTIVPKVDNTPVSFKANWTANAAADTFNMQGGNGTGDQWSLIAPVAGGTAHTVAFGTVLSQLVTAVPTVNYKVSAVGGVAINVASFDYSL